MLLVPFLNRKLFDQIYILGRCSGSNIHGGMKSRDGG